MEADPETEENRRRSSVSFKDGDGREIQNFNSSPKVPRKFINNWKHACDRTKDRTRELLKKWRTIPDAGQPEVGVVSQSSEISTGSATNWTEHVWTTWVKRSSSAEEEVKKNYEMTEIQKKKFNHFFVSYLDLDRDDFISLADFDAFTERLRHFSDWSKNSTEYNRLKEVQRGFIETFLLPSEEGGTIRSYDELEKKLKKEQLSMDQWLEKWNSILSKSRNFYELPHWLQYFPKILFHAINRRGTGDITKEELSAFFSSLLSLSPTQVDPHVNEAYNALTSRNQHPLTFPVYRLCFANFVFARCPNGPGQYLFGPMSGMEKCTFAVDYKLLNCTPGEFERYNAKMKSNRTSIIV